MFARVSAFQVGAQPDLSALTGPPPSEIQELEGFRGAYTMLNRETGRAMLITLWESQEALRASSERANQTRAQAVQATGGSGPAQVETFEVLSHP